MKLLLLLIISIIIGVTLSFTPKSKDTLFFEDFSDVVKSTSNWIQSSNSEYSGIIAFKPAAYNPNENDNGLVLTQAARRYAVTNVLKESIKNEGKELIVQYELQFQDGVTCSGGYIKLYTDREDFDATKVDANTPYSIMFGADVCGQNDRIHFIVRHKNPITGEYQEKLITAKPSVRKDRVSHVYTLIIRPDNTFTIKVDNESVLDGNFDDSFTPAFDPAKEIDDPSDSKPLDWVDEAKIQEPGATKPDDWDEEQPLRVVDPEATKPSDWLDNEPLLIVDPEESQPAEWNEEDDGEWEAPLISNPKCVTGQCGEWEAPTIPNPLYKGKWSAPMIPNPAYIGEWKPKQIANPDYYHVENPYIVDPIIAVGIEVLSNSKDVIFDNFIITHNKEEAQQLLEENWRPKYNAQKEKQAEFEAEAAKKLAADKGDGILSTIQFYLELFQTEAAQNPLLYVVAGSSLLLPIVFCFTRGSKKSKAVVNKPTNTTESTTTVTKESVIQDKPAIESDDDSSSEDEKSKKSTVTKRTNKVK